MRELLVNQFDHPGGSCPAHVVGPLTDVLPSHNQGSPHLVANLLAVGNPVAGVLVELALAVVRLVQLTIQDGVSQTGASDCFKRRVRPDVMPELPSPRDTF
jgi:hypothetical protein